MELLTYLLTNIWYVLLVALAFGGSIFVHELGHFWVARKRGMHVDRFSIGFGPKLWAWRGKDGVEYRISWLPLGGYVALPQLAAMRGIEGEIDADLTKLPPPSYLTLMLVLVAGVVCNVILAFGLATILWVVGLPSVQEELSTKVGYVRVTLVQTDGTEVAGPALKALAIGDEILSVDGREVQNFSDIDHLVALGAGRNAAGGPQVVISFRRDNETKTVLLTPAYVGPEKIRSIGIDTGAKPAIATVEKGSVAEAVGLRPKDVILRIDGKAVGDEEDVIAQVQASAGHPMVLSYSRDGQLLELTVTPRLEAPPGKSAPVPRLGIGLTQNFTRTLVHTPPWTQLQDHAIKTWWTLSSLLNRHSDIGLSKLSGPGGIADRLHTLAQIDIRLMLAMTVLLNVNFAIFNLLPIPVLDGGHMVFATIGRIRRRPLPARFMATTMSVFMVLLLSMVIYVTFFDARRFFADRYRPAPAIPVAPAQP
ncbi:MAG: RIP metalloprotease RseP [Verrucomicrobiota bacterium]